MPSKVRRERDTLESLREDFGLYSLALNPDHKYVRYQQEEIVPLLEMVERSEIRRLLILIHPGASKTCLTSVDFMSWFLGRNPKLSAIGLSYSSSLAVKSGRKVKNRLKHPLHAELFPQSQLSMDSRAAHRFTTIAGGEYNAVGYNGTIFGLRADCVPGSAVIETEDGPMPIRDLVRLRWNAPRVLSYNHESGECEFKSITATRETVTDELYEISTSGGHTLRCTENHRIYDSERGYRKASLLGVGTRILAAKIPAQRDLSGVPSPKGRTGRDVSELLQPDARKHDRSPLRSLLGGIYSAALQLREVLAAWARPPVLQPLVFVGVSGSASTEPTPMPDVWGRHPTEPKGSLLGYLRTYGERSLTGIGSVPGLPNPLSGHINPTSILHTDVREYCSRRADERVGKLSFQDGNELLKVVRRDAPLDHGAGRLALRRLQELLKQGLDRLLGRPSHRRGPEEQQVGEPDRALQCVPYGSPQVEGDSVSMVRRLRYPGERVYDIQVWGNSNFFADGVLVHNCLIIDDPLKSEKEARSQSVSRWAFTRGIIKSRLKPGGRIVACTTRLCVGDWCSKLMEDEPWIAHDDPKFKERDPSAWVVLKLPAEKNGVYLWEEHLGREHYEDAKKDPKSWAALYMQDPSSGYTGPWFASIPLITYEGTIKPGKFPAYMIVDPGLSKAQSADPTSIMILVATPEKKLILADWVLDRLDPDERTNHIIRLLKRWEPRRFIYEEFGLVADSFHLKRDLKEAGLHVYPIPVGRKGQRHLLSTEDRIRELIIDFKDERFIFPETMVRKLVDGTEVDLMKYLREDEYQIYAGEGSVYHDEGLDTLSRSHEPELAITYPDAPGSEKEEGEYSDASGGGSGGGLSWEALYLLPLAVMAIGWVV